MWVAVLLVGGIYGPFWSRAEADAWLWERHRGRGNPQQVHPVS